MVESLTSTLSFADRITQEDSSVQIVEYEIKYPHTTTDPSSSPQIVGDFTDWYPQQMRAEVFIQNEQGQDEYIMTYKARVPLGYKMRYLFYTYKYH